MQPPKYPDYVLESPVMNMRLEQEAVFEINNDDYLIGKFWAIAVRPSDGFPVVNMNFIPSPLEIEPHEVQKNFAADLLRALHKEASFGGGWLVGFTHPPEMVTSFIKAEEPDNVWARMFFIWLDEDGDPQFTVDTQLPVMHVLSAGVENYLGLAYKAKQEWDEYAGKTMLKEMGVKDSQMVKAAQGEVMQ